MLLQYGVIDLFARTPFLLLISNSYLTGVIIAFSFIHERLLVFFFLRTQKFYGVKKSKVLQIKEGVLQTNKGVLARHLYLNEDVAFFYWLNEDVAFFNWLNEDVALFYWLNEGVTLF